MTKQIEEKIKEIIERLGDPRKFNEEDAKSPLLSVNTGLVEIVEKDSGFYIRPHENLRKYISEPKSNRKNWDAVEVEKIEAYPYFITRAGIHYCYDGSSDDLGFLYYKAEVDRIAPKDAGAYRMRYDTFGRYTLFSDDRQNDQSYDIALIDFYKIKSYSPEKVVEKYDEKQISVALNRLNLGALEEHVMEILRSKK